MSNRRLQNSCRNLPPTLLTATIPLMQPREYDLMYELETTYWWHTGMAAIMEQILAPTFNPDSTLLDVGCGTGAKMQLLSQYCAVSGIDMHPRAIELCHQRGLEHTQIGDATALSFENETFSHAICCEVLQNLDNDGQGVREAFRVLKPGGYYYVSEQAYPILRSQHDISQGSMRRYTRARLHSLLSDAGFTVKRMTSANTILFPMMAALRLASKTVNPPSSIDPEQSRSDLKPLPEPVNYMLRSILEVERIIIKKRNLPFGLTIIALAQK